MVEIQALLRFCGVAFREDTVYLDTDEFPPSEGRWQYIPGPGLDRAPDGTVRPKFHHPRRRPIYETGPDGVRNYDVCQYEEGVEEDTDVEDPPPALAEEPDDPALEEQLVRLVEAELKEPDGDEGDRVEQERLEGPAHQLDAVGARVVDREEGVVRHDPRVVPVYY